jgi:hypothetical protein
VKRGLAAGTIAGAVGTLALDAVSYGDMLLQGRTASALPGQAAARLAESVGVRLGAPDSDAAGNRGAALGALLGYGTGVAVGAAFGVWARRRSPGATAGPALCVVAMVVANGPMVAQRLTDPRTWGPRGWLSDIVPHLAYGWATVSTYRAITAPEEPGR